MRRNWLWAIALFISVTAGPCALWLALVNKLPNLILPLAEWALSPVAAGRQLRNFYGLFAAAFFFLSGFLPVMILALSSFPSPATRARMKDSTKASFPPDRKRT
jgi:hypothetical protein